MVQYFIVSLAMHRQYSDMWCSYGKTDLEIIHMGPHVIKTS